MKLKQLQKKLKLKQLQLKLKQLQKKLKLKQLQPLLNLFKELKLKQLQLKLEQLRVKLNSCSQRWGGVWGGAGEWIYVEVDGCVIIPDGPANSAPPPPPMVFDPLRDALHTHQLRNGWGLWRTPECTGRKAEAPMHRVVQSGAPWPYWLRQRLRGHQVQQNINAWGEVYKGLALELPVPNTILPCWCQLCLQLYRDRQECFRCLGDKLWAWKGYQLLHEARGQKGTTFEASTWKNARTAWMRSTSKGVPRCQRECQTERQIICQKEYQILSDGKTE